MTSRRRATLLACIVSCSGVERRCVGDGDGDGDGESGCSRDGADLRCVLLSIQMATPGQPVSIDI